jgi:hypothetical protein
MRSSISHEEFRAIVSGIMESDKDVRDYSITENSVSLSVFAPMRRENVNAFLDFDDRGAITGRFSYAQTDINAQKPREIGAQISCEIINLLRQ